MDGEGSPAPDAKCRCVCSCSKKREREAGDGYGRGDDGDGEGPLDMRIRRSPVGHIPVRADVRALVGEDLAAAAAHTGCSRIVPNGKMPSDIQAREIFLRDINGLQCMHPQELARRLRSPATEDRKLSVRRVIPDLYGLCTFYGSNKFAEYVRLSAGTLISVRVPDNWYLLIRSYSTVFPAHHKNFADYLCCEETLTVVGVLVVRTGERMFDNTDLVVTVSDFGRVYVYDGHTDGLYYVLDHVVHLADIGLRFCPPVYRHPLLPTTPSTLPGDVMNRLVEASFVGVERIMSVVSDLRWVRVSMYCPYSTTATPDAVTFLDDMAVFSKHFFPFCAMHQDELLRMHEYLNALLQCRYHLIAAVSHYRYQAYPVAKACILMDAVGSIYAYDSTTSDVSRIAEDLAMFLRCGLLFYHYDVSRFDRDTGGALRLERAPRCPHKRDARLRNLAERADRRPDIWDRQQWFEHMWEMLSADVFPSSLSYVPDNTPVIQASFPPSSVYIREFDRPSAVTEARRKRSLLRRGPKNFRYPFLCPSELRGVSAVKARAVSVISSTASAAPDPSTTAPKQARSGDTSPVSRTSETSAGPTASEADRDGTSDGEEDGGRSIRVEDLKVFDCSVEHDHQDDQLPPDERTLIHRRVTFAKKIISNGYVLVKPKIPSEYFP
uniref:Gp143 n=1 Tax=Caviid herpesvirus 2 str. CIDMTR TaxID=1415526 RepID=U6H6W2_9BETA|nr:gp143 [Caviid herpesvirus 2 str. CIDMTR]